MHVIAVTIIRALCEHCTWTRWNGASRVARVDFALLTPNESKARFTPLYKFHGPVLSLVRHNNAARTARGDKCQLRFIVSRLTQTEAAAKLDSPIKPFLGQTLLNKMHSLSGSIIGAHGIVVSNIYC